MKKMISILLVVGILMNIIFANIANAQTTVDQILEKMTTEQKIAQMLMPAFRQYEGENVTTMNPKMEEILKKYGFGGVILFAENNASTEQTVKLIDSMQKANATVDGRTQLLIAVDQEGARVVRLANGTQGPGNMGLGATGEQSNAYDMGEITGAELSKIGYNVNFAPVVDVNNNPSNPVIGVRSFSDDAETVFKFASSYMNGLSGQNVIASLKHFPGHGDTATDSHTGLPRIEKTYDELKENELVPFQGCINDGAEMIMTAHIQYPKIETGTYTSIKDGSTIELPATLSKTIITDILRGDLNYDGVVITDAMNMSAIAQNFNVLDSARLAINAGVDMILMPIDTATESGIDALDQFIVDVANLVDSGDISIENVNKAVTRILTLKENHGLLNQYSLDDLQERIDAANAFVGSKTNHDKEWEIAKKSITLVKNNGMLPIKENEKTVVVVQYANEVLSAEYAVDRLKNENIIDENMDVTVFLMREKEMPEIKNAIQDAKNVLVFTEQGSVSVLAGDTYKKFDEMIEFVHSKENRIAFISCNQPYDVARLQEADALLLAWSPKGMDEKPDFSNGSVKSYGVGMPVGVYMAFGKDAEVTGKLPLNIPALDDEYKYTEELLYERGYGLKYGSYTLENIVEKFNSSDTVKSYKDLGYECYAYTGKEEPNVLSITLTTSGESTVVSYELDGNVLYYDHLVDSNALTAFLLADAIGQLQGYEDGELFANFNMFSEEVFDYTVEDEGFEIKKNDSYYATKMDITKKVPLKDISEFYLKPSDFDMIKEYVDEEKTGNQSGRKLVLAYDVTVEKGKNTICIGESGDLTDSAYNSILSAIEVLYGNGGADFFRINYPQFKDGITQLDGFTVEYDVDIDVEEHPIYTGTKAVLVSFNNEYMNDVFLRKEYIGELVESGEKTLTIDFTNNTYKLGLFDSVKSGGDAGFLYKFILEPIYSESGVEFSGDTAYFNVVDGKIVVGNENNSIFKLVIDEESFEMTLSPTKTNVTKTTVTANRENVETYEFDICNFADHNHWRTIKYSKVIINITYGKTTRKSSGGRSTSSNNTTTPVNTSILENVDDWAKEEMKKAEARGLISETFAKKDATKAILRSEYAAVAVKFYEIISGKKAEPVTNNPFVDTNDEYVLKAYALGITLGTSENTFTPNAEITREQVATMLTRALSKAGINITVDIINIPKFVDDNDLSDWGRPSVYFMAKEEIIKGIGDNRFNGLGNAKIEEAIAIALRSIEVFGK